MKKLYLIFAMFMPMLPPWQSPINAADHRADAFVVVGTVLTLCCFYNFTSRQLSTEEAVINGFSIPIGICIMLEANEIVNGFDSLKRRN